MHAALGKLWQQQRAAETAQRAQGVLAVELEDAIAARDAATADAQRYASAVSSSPWNPMLGTSFP